MNIRNRNGALRDAKPFSGFLILDCKIDIIAFLYLILYNRSGLIVSETGDKMRTEQLKYLVDVAETRSMNKSAERLFVSPQAVSKAIKQLENELDAELLVRTSTGVMLTHIGEEVVAHAQRILQEELVINQTIAKSKHRVQEDNTFPVRICSTSAITNIVLPDIMAKFSYVNVNILPRIYMVDSIEAVFDDVQSGRCDLGLLTYNEEVLFRKFLPYQQELDMDFLARDEQVVVMDAHLYRSGQNVVSQEEFVRHFCCMFSILPIDEHMQQFDATHVMKSNDADFHRAMIKKADAYVLMPHLAYKHFFPGKSYVALPLEGEWPTMLHAAVYRKDAAEELRRFASLIRLGLQ